MPETKLKRYTSLDADQSAHRMAKMLRDRVPFFYLRFGDGALECISGHKGRTCDGERYSPELGVELLRAWVAASRGQNVYLGDWLSASFSGPKDQTRYESLYETLIGSARPKFLHFEALLLMRQSEALLDFYRAVKRDPRKKLLMGPKENAGAANMLGAEFLEVPMNNLFECRANILGQLFAREFDVLLYGAGMAGNIPVARCWEQYPNRTYIHLGSALDPLFRGRSRQQQLQPNVARKLFAEFF